MLQGGKAAHQETSDDDDQRGDLVKPMEEEKPSLVCERSRARLDRAPKCEGCAGVKEVRPRANWILAAGWQNAKRFAKQIACCNVVFGGCESGFPMHTL